MPPADCRAAPGLMLKHESLTASIRRGLVVHIVLFLNGIVEVIFMRFPWFSSLRRLDDHELIVIVINHVTLVSRDPRVSIVVASSRNVQNRLLILFLDLRLQLLVLTHQLRYELPLNLTGHGYLVDFPS